MRLESIFAYILVAIVVVACKPKDNRNGSFSASTTGSVEISINGKGFDGGWSEWRQGDLVMRSGVLLYPKDQKGASIAVGFDSMKPGTTIFTVNDKEISVKGRPIAIADKERGGVLVFPSEVTDEMFENEESLKVYILSVIGEAEQKGDGPVGPNP